MLQSAALAGCRARAANTLNTRADETGSWRTLAVRFCATMKRPVRGAPLQVTMRYFTITLARCKYTV